MGKYKKIVDEYLVNYKNESENFRTLYVQLNKNDEKYLIDRKNFVGHFTASAFVLSKNSKEVLMIHHKALKRYLQPGGHIDILDKSLLEAAKREFFEETGINFRSLEYKCFYSFNESVPFNISVHMISENWEKKEDAHYHYDLQYLFFCEEKPNIVINKDEASSYEWVSWGVFKKIPEYENVFRKIENTSKTVPETFLYDFVSNVRSTEISCVAIQHITKTGIPLIKTLMKIFGENLLICAKPNSIDREV